MSSHPAPPGRRMRVRLVIIGDEVLGGKVEDANTPYLLRRLRALGAVCDGVEVVPDAVDRVAAAVREASASSDLVITTGGVGPTHDDVTVDGVAAAFGLPVVEDPFLRRLIETRWTRSTGPARLRMARVPEGAELLGDPVFPTLQVRNVWVFPGVPRLLRSRFEQLEGRLRCAPMRCAAVGTNQGESEIAPLLEAVLAAHPGVSIGSYPQWDRTDLRVRVTLEAEDADLLTAAVDALVSGLDPTRLVGVDRDYRPHEERQDLRAPLTSS